MNGPHRSLRRVLACLAGLAGLAVYAATADASQARPASVLRTITFATPWTGGHQTQIDLGTKGLGPGDIFLITGRPMLSQGNQIGTLEGVEAILSSAHDGIVSQQATLRLAGGRVMVEGVGRQDDKPFRLAVVGGTGNYIHASGQLTALGEDAKNKLYLFKLVLRR